MIDTEFSVDLFNPHGIYPSKTVVCEDIVYLLSSGIPMLASKSENPITSRWEPNKRRELLFGAFLLTRKSSPCFSFYPFPIASIHFKNTDISETITQAAEIISFKRKLPCLYNPYSGKGDPTDPVAYIKRLRSSDAYIDLFHAPQLPFPELIATLRTRYSFCQNRFRPELVAGLYRRLSSSSRWVHIAIHYFVNAARLIHEHFIEDAGLNLNLVLEAIIEDFSCVLNIKNKKQAIEKLQAEIILPDYHMEFLEDLYLARNEFLAHIDKEMFTHNQNINDPDRYCYEHFESISWLIRRYIKYL